MVKDALVRWIAVGAVLTCSMPFAAAENPDSPATRQITDPKSIDATTNYEAEGPQRTIDWFDRYLKGPSSKAAAAGGQ